MSAMTNYLENKLIDQIFRGQGFSFPSTLYFALFTAAPSDVGGGTELSGSGYSRTAVSASLTAFAGTQEKGSTAASTGTSGVTSNNLDVEFPTALADWGTATHVAILDAATGGNLLLYGELSKAKVIKAGVAPKFKPGTMVLTLDGV